MRLRDQFRFVRQNMKKNRTRVFMTILATAMGCAFLNCPRLRRFWTTEIGGKGNN